MFLVINQFGDVNKQIFGLFNTHLWELDARLPYSRQQFGGKGLPKMEAKYLIIVIVFGLMALQMSSVEGNCVCN